MADLTQEIPLTALWKNITSVARLDEESDYVLTLQGVGPNGYVLWALTDNGNVAPAVTGHAWYPYTPQREADQREGSPSSGVWLWMRAVGGDCSIVVSQS